MKSLHKLLIGSIALVLVGTGILITSTEPEYNPVYGFTDVNCTYNLKFFLSIEEMDEYSRADNGWKDNSYIEFLKSDECVKVVRAVGTRPGEGEGEGDGTEPGGGGSRLPSPPDPATQPTIVFDDDALNELNEKWQGCADNIESEYGEYELEYRVQTEYTWITDQSDTGVVWGETQHSPHNIVTIYPISMRNAIQNQEWDIEFDHMVAQTSLMEYIHTIQEPFDVLTDSKFDREVESYNLSFYWYRAIWNKQPPFKRWSRNQIVKAKLNSFYVTDWEEIKELQKKAKDDGLSEVEKNRLFDLQQGLYRHLPEYKINRRYEKGSLECE